MLPIIIGVGITVIAITVSIYTRETTGHPLTNMDQAKSVISATSKFRALSLAEIAELNGLIFNSSQSRSVAYHDSLREQFKQYPGGFGEKMTESEALEVLSIRGGDIMKFDKEMLKQKHRKSMIMNHPDRGGSAYLAMKINEAKAVLETGYMFKK